MRQEFSTSIASVRLLACFLFPEQWRQKGDLDPRLGLFETLGQRGISTGAARPDPCCRSFKPQENLSRDLATESHLIVDSFGSALGLETDWLPLMLSSAAQFRCRRSGGNIGWTKANMIDAIHNMSSDFLVPTAPNLKN